MRRATRSAAIAAACCAGLASDASAQTLDLLGMVGGQDGVTSARIAQLFILLSTLAVAPGLLMMVTCFPRFIIAFSFLRAGIGLPSTPSNMILIGLALFMTLHVMGGEFDRAWNEGLQPLSENKLKPDEALRRIAAPFKEFMYANTRPKELEAFVALANARPGASQTPATDYDLRVLVPAFLVSELRRGFEIGFLLILPFLVIDLVVATVVMSMGMMMLSPQAFSMPLKILFFVLVDGWSLLVGALTRSYV